ncbi:uncharacterized protein LOC127098109 [Lathyrus oleraceus]|uniref:uncharacterized protein LOC127098109 n=1 Tax=Pisum sativum TaxID=3888 RepID=UPI0021CF8B19|nr:uncharacterized protein LOC127098109 [Pisum sativum]
MASSYKENKRQNMEQFAERVWSNLDISKDQLKIYAWTDIKILLQSNGRSLTDFPTMPHPNMSLLPEYRNRLADDELNDDTETNLKAKAKLIIWDETPMMHKYCKGMDRNFRDILRFSDEGNMNTTFGGKVMVFNGDFSKILPDIPKGTMLEVVHATINFDGSS